MNDLDLAKAMGITPFDDGATMVDKELRYWRAESKRMNQENDHLARLSSECERLRAVYEAAKVIQYRQVAASASEFVDLQAAIAAVKEKDEKESKP